MFWPEAQKEQHLYNARGRRQQLKEEGMAQED